MAGSGQAGVVVEQMVGALGFATLRDAAIDEDAPGGERALLGDLVVGPASRVAFRRTKVRQVSASVGMVF